MATRPERQVSFASGGLAPGFHGRTDINAYKNGCRIAKNFIVGPQGQLISRPGTVKVAVLTPSTTHCELVPFILSDLTGVVVAFRESYTPQFFKNGTELAVSFLGASLWREKVKTAQVGDVMTVTSPDQVPQELVSTAADGLSWEMEEVNFRTPQFPLLQQIRTHCFISDWKSGSVSVEEVKWTWLVTLVVEEDGRTYETRGVVVSKAVIDSERFEDEEDKSYPGMWRPAENGAVYIYGSSRYYWYPERLDYWYQPKHDNQVGTSTPPHLDLTNWAEYPRSLAGAWQTLADNLETVAAEYELTPERPVTLSFVQNVGGEIIKAYRIYRGRSGVFGLVGQTTDGEFVDDGATPNWAVQPPLDEYMFDGYGMPDIVSPAKFKAVAFFENRRLFAGHEDFPGVLFGSALSEFARFDDPPGPNDTDAYSLELSSSVREDIQDIVEASDLLLFTDAGVWRIDGADGGPITPNSQSARKVSSNGCGELRPLQLEDSIWWVRQKNNFPTALRVQRQSGGSSYQELDVATLWQHLFKKHTIVSWCFAEDPYKMIWAVRDDGVLLSCAVNLIQELTAWTIHEMNGATVLWVAAIPEGAEDMVYLVVQRGTRLYIERMASRDIDDIDDAICLDGAVRLDGRNTTSTKTLRMALAGGDTAEYLSGLNLTASGHTPAVGEMYRVNGVDSDGDDASVVVEVTSVVGGGVFRAQFLDAPEATLLNVTTSDWAECVSSVDGLGHLAASVAAGGVLTALADGAVVREPDLAFDGSRVLLPNPTAVATVGVSYTCDFESLDMSEARDKQKIVQSVSLELETSAGCFVGQSLEDDDYWIAQGRGIGTRPMQEVVTRTVDAPNTMLRRETNKVPVPGNWDYHARVALRQEDPLPVTILGITREVKVGG